MNTDKFNSNPIFPGTILCMRPANGRRHYIVMSSPIGWAHTRNDPCQSLLLISIIKIRQWWDHHENRKSYTSKTSLYWISPLISLYHNTLWHIYSLAVANLDERLWFELKKFTTFHPHGQATECLLVTWAYFGEKWLCCFCQKGNCQCSLWWKFHQNNNISISVWKVSVRHMLR